LGGICDKETVAIQRCQGGCRSAFEFIVNRYMKQAYSIALGFVGNREDALDLSQEAFFRAYSNIEKLNPQRKFFPWFYHILRNLCFSHLRKRKVRRAYSLDGENSPEVAAEGGGWFDPEAVAEKDEAKAAVWEAIGDLDEKHREVIILRHFENLSYERIAQILFCNKGTVMSRLYHARKKLKKLLDSEKGGGINELPR